jgi:hypothetical protein
MPDEKAERGRLQLSTAQVAASALASISAAVLCSFFGVAGTVIGTAITSLVATVGSALYSYSLGRTKERLRRLHRAGAASPPVAEVLRTMRQQGRRLLTAVPWAPIGIGAMAVFVFTIGVVTVIEASAGETLSALLGVGNTGARRTTIGSIVGAGPHRHHKATPSPTPTPTVTTTPTATVSPSPTATPSPTSTPTPSKSPPNLLGGLFPSRSPTTAPTTAPTTQPTPTPTPR